MQVRRKPSSRGGVISALPLRYALIGVGFFFALCSSRASAVAIISDPFPPPNEGPTSPIWSISICKLPRAPRQAAIGWTLHLAAQQPIAVRAYYCQVA